MRKYLLLLFCALGSMTDLLATHNVAGEITYRSLGPDNNGNCLTYEITVTTYTDMRSQADRCSLNIDFGDSSPIGIAYRDPATSDPNLASLCGNNPSIGGGHALGSSYPNFKRNIYKIIHTYPGPGNYIISMKDPNRVAGICNIVNSVNVQFYLQSLLVINPFMGCNYTSPQLANIPLDKACVGQCFYHNPGAYIPPPPVSYGIQQYNDSIHYSLVPCMDTTQQPLVGWSPLPVTSNGSVSIDPNTGLMSWCSPPDICVYNIDIKIEVWRLIGNQRFLIGYVLRDMEIITGPCVNNNPVLTEPSDLCVLAGTNVSFNITGTDPNAYNLNLSASGDVFNVTPPVANFPDIPGVGLFTGGPLTGTFNWSTTCDHVRKQPHQVIFRLENDGGGNQTHLLDYESVNITVIAPAPQNLQSSPFGQTMNLHWNPERCNPQTNNFVKYEIYRRIGPDANTPGPCVTGVPPPWGYTLIGYTPNGHINDTTFTDNNNGQGLIPGVTYCYRVVALFSDGAESQPSDKTCNDLRRDIPVITNVDVDSTSTLPGAAIIVKWKNAIANTNTFFTGLDTVAYPGPYKIEVYRSQGFNLNSPVLVQTFNSAFLYNLADSLRDTSVPLNTTDYPWTYRIDFYAMGTTLIGSTQKASSIYLTLTPSDHKLTLTWQEVVPWSNFLYDVYRQAPNGTWNIIGSTTNQTYIDSNLINRHVYCYYVRSHGSYFNPTIPDTLYNRSQRNCKAPRDLTPPCPPQLNMTSDCEQFTNTLVWTDPNHHCADDVVTYTVWFSDNGTDPYQAIQQIAVSTDTVLVLSNLNSVAGCYAVTATDSLIDNYSNTSVFSNIVCADNCPVYELPNVFSPNGDGLNDFYSALPYRYIESVDMKIYDRWGVLMFETSDPHIHWDGKSKQSGQICTDGVYYYICVVNEKRLIGIVPHTLKGFIQLISSPEHLH